MYDLGSNKRERENTYLVVLFPINTMFVLFVQILHI